MKKQLIIALFFGSIASGFSQNKTIPTGEYLSEENGLILSLLINEDNTFKLSMAQGNVEKDKKTYNFKTGLTKRPVFNVKFKTEKKPSDSIQLTFKHELNSYKLGDVFIATKQTKEDSLVYSQPKDYSKSKSYYTEDTDKEYSFSVPRSKYIYFLENPKSIAGNTLISYEIPKKVSEIIVDFKRTRNEGFQLSGAYNKDEKSFTLSENGRNPMTFRKNYTSYIESFEKPLKIEKDIYIPNEVSKPAPAKTYKSKYEFELETFTSLDAAVAKTKKEEKILVGFYLPKNPNAKKEFDNFLKTYERNISNKMYNKYLPSYDNFYFYLIETEQEKKQFKENLEANTMIAINAEKQFLYTTKVSMSKQQYFFSTLTSKENSITDAALMRKVDNYIKNENLQQEKLQELFLELVTVNAYALKSGHKSTEQQTYKSQKDIENKVDYYKLKADPEQVDLLFSILVKAHKKDTKVDFDYAHIISKLLKLNYRNTLYKDYDYYMSDALLEAINYLYKFKEPILNYKAPQDADYTRRNYYFKDLFRHTISNAISKVARKADKTKLENMKKLMQKITTEDPKSYLTFLRTYLPKDYLKEYQAFYEENFDTKENIVLALDKLYNKLNSTISWQYFKEDYANQANTAAWFVVKNSAEKKEIKQALEWSKTSLEILPKNPFYLDTQAHLLYKKGDIKQAIKVQKQAVKVLNEKPGKYSGSRTTTKIRVALKEMEEDTFKN